MSLTFAALFCFLLFLFVYFFFYIFWCASRIDLGHSGWIIPGTSALLHSLDCLSQHFFQWKKCSAVTLKKIQCDTHIQHGGLLLVKNYLFTCKYKHLSISYWEFCRRGDLKTLHLLCIWWIMRYWRSNLTC